MTAKTLATKLLGFRSSSSLMVPGQLCAELGEEAMREALDRGWIEPNYDTGYLQLSGSAGRLQEMRELAEKCCEKCKKEPCECEPCPPQEESASRDFIVRHAHRHESTYGLGSNAPASGAIGSGQPTRATQPPPRPPMSSNPQQQEYLVGEDVVVADEGKSYQAKVASKNPDGTYKLSFGPNRPVTQDRVYRREELQRSPTAKRAIRQSSG